ncbi:hypothetical protein [Virgisporangium aurantiacum]|uniref:Uncharacterized protein n=1 Tax=Virgisporangium aurantiacum TaxID=175570 RepID=A0A8J3ZHS8_9ACTN|nr:hypothetical protein [Virgisporangium aurantiacum]GIJ63172.1 hypothetical protein Vau01_106880 [Virgisporangium aurantiacum]
MAEPDRVAKARAVLAQLGVSVAELQTAEAVGVAMPCGVPKVVSPGGGVRFRQLGGIR